MMRSRTFWFACLIALAVLSSVAPAQLATGAFAGGERADEHAWAVTPSTMSSDWGLWHIPPRFGRGGAQDGEIRIVDSLERQPAALAASGGRVWMAFAGSGNQAGYGILTAAVQPGAIDGTWFTGTGGRLASAAYLATRAKLLSMAAGPRGPVVLVAPSDGPAQIAWLERGTWKWAATPVRDQEAPPTAVGVLADGTLCLTAVGGGAIHTWRAVLPEAETSTGGYELLDTENILSQVTPPADEQPESIKLEWTPVTASFVGSDDDARVVAGPIGIGSRIVLALQRGSQVQVLDVHGAQATEVYAAPAGGIGLLAASRRGLIVHLGDDAKGAHGRAATMLVVDEFSLDTGRSFYQGPAVFDGPVSPSDIRILLVLMVLISATLLLFVVRTTGESTPFVAPTGTVLAAPMPRLMASITDGLLAFLLGGQVASLLPEGWLAMRIGADVLDFAPIIVALGLGFLAYSALEATTGRTPGKFIFGLYVSRTGEENGNPVPPRRPGIGASLARNAVKWLLPLVAFAGTTSPAMRHKGDTMTGLGVIGEALTEPGEGQSGQDHEPDDR